MSSDEYWRWFDAMPKDVREAINNAKSLDEIQYLWNSALYEHGAEIERKIR